MGDPTPSLETYRIAVSVAVVVVIAVMALMVLILGLSWPALITVVIVGILAAIGGWFYLKWARMVTNVSKDMPDTTRLRSTRHQVKRYRKP